MNIQLYCLDNEGILDCIIDLIRAIPFVRALSCGIVHWKLHRNQIDSGCSVYAKDQSSNDAFH